MSWPEIQDFPSGLGVTGGASGRVAFFTGASSIAGDGGMTYNAATDSLTVTGVVTGASGTFSGTVTALGPVYGQNFRYGTASATSGVISAPFNSGANATTFGFGYANATSGAVMATQFLFPSASALVPDLGLARSAAGVLKVTDGGAGWGSVLTNGVTVQDAGFSAALLNYEGLALKSDSFVGWSSSGTNYTPRDLLLTRAAAATLQLGAAASATPVAQTLQAQGSRGGTDTNVPGAALTVRPGSGTGNGTAAVFNVDVPYVTSSGTTQQLFTTALQIRENAVEPRFNTYPGGSDTLTLGASTRLWSAAYLSRATLGSKSKDLTESSATGFVDIAVTAGQRISGEVIYEVYAADATDFQTITGTLRYAAVNKGGTTTVSVSEVGTQTSALSAGTLTATNTAADTTNKITLYCDAASSLTQTTLEIRYRINSVSTNTVTPL